MSKEQIMKKILTIIVLGLLLCNKAFSLPKCQGEDVSKWTMCEGIKTTSKGSKYVGEFKDGKYHGKGTITNAAGDKYIGGWNNGKFFGEGTLTQIKKVVFGKMESYTKKILYQLLIKKKRLLKA